MHRSDFKRWARCTLLWCASVLLISPLPGGWLVDHLPLHIRFPLAAQRISNWHKASPSPNVVMLGSSRLESFLAPTELATMTNELLGKNSVRIFNATAMGGEPNTMEFVTRQLLAGGNPPPRLVVLETNLDLLARDNLYLKLVITRQLTAADLPKYMSDIVFSKATSRLLSSRLTPFFLYRSQLIGWADEVARSRSDKENISMDKRPSGMLNQEAAPNREKELPPPEERVRGALRRLQTHLRHYQLAGATSSAFEATVERLRARGCAIVLVQTPVISRHRALFDPAMRSQFEAFVQRLCRTYGCEFVDYSDRLPDTSFSDNHHANAAGTSGFTALLAHEVIAPAWRKLEVDREE